MRRADQKWMQLIAPRRAMRADLVVERHDLVPVIRPEDRDVPGIRLPDEVLHRAHDALAGAVWIEWILAREHLERAIGDARASQAAFQMYECPNASSKQADARMLEQLAVQRRAP